MYVKRGASGNALVRKVRVGDSWRTETLAWLGEALSVADAVEGFRVKLASAEASQRELCDYAASPDGRFDCTVNWQRRVVRRGRHEIGVTKWTLKLEGWKVGSQFRYCASRARVQRL